MKKRKKYKPTKDLLPRGKAMSEEPDEFKISFIKFEFEVVKTYLIKNLERIESFKINKEKKQELRGLIEKSVENIRKVQSILTELIKTK